VRLADGGDLVPDLVSEVGGLLVGEVARRKLRESALETGALVLPDHLLGLLFRRLAQELQRPLLL